MPYTILWTTPYLKILVIWHNINQFRIIENYCNKGDFYQMKRNQFKQKTTNSSMYFESQEGDIYIPEVRQLSSGNWSVQLRKSIEDVTATTPKDKDRIEKTFALLKSEYTPENRASSSEGNTLTLKAKSDSYIDADEQTFQEFSEKFVKLKELAGKEHKTIQFYNSLLERINPIIGDRRLSSITSNDIEDLFIKIGEPGQNKTTGDKLSPKTILEHLRLISAIYNTAIMRELVSKNPTIGVDKPKIVHKKANYFQPSELHKIHEALENEPLKWKLMTLLLMYTGCRRAEIVGLSWENVNFAENVININRTILYSAEKGIYESTTKTLESNRSLKLPLEAVELLRKQKELQDEKKANQGKRWKYTSYVFTQEDGSPMHPDSITFWLSKFSKRNCLPHINPHAFRHTMASILIYKGVDIANVSKYLGHSSIRTTLNTYTHIIDEYNASKEKMIIGDIIMEIN